MFYILAIVCEDPGNPANGSSNVLAESNSTLAIGTVIKYMCLPGFKLVGSIERVCQPNGEWNGTMPVCQPVCQSNSQHTDFTMLNFVNVFRCY